MNTYREEEGGDKPHDHCVGVGMPRRNAVARAACVVRGGPPSLAHHTYSARNATSTTAASGTPRLRSNNGQTLAGMSHQKARDDGPQRGGQPRPPAEMT